MLKLLLSIYKRSINQNVEAKARNLMECTHGKDFKVGEAKDGVSYDVLQSVNVRGRNGN